MMLRVEGRAVAGRGGGLAGRLRVDRWGGAGESPNVGTTENGGRKIGSGGTPTGSFLRGG